MATASSDLNAEGSCPPIRRLLLLGFKGSGKTSTLRTILSQEKNPSDHSLTEQQHWIDVLNWRLLVIDTLGFQIETEDIDEKDSENQPSIIDQCCPENQQSIIDQCCPENQPSIIDQCCPENQQSIIDQCCPENQPSIIDQSCPENQQSIIDQCSPGPHAVLLVVPISAPFTELHWQGLWPRVTALGAGIWRHTMVLFTCADQIPKDKGVEEFIVDAGAALQRLVERCGCRYHAVDNNLSDKSAQVAELLQKVEEMVQENQGWFFEMERTSILFEDEEMQREREEDRGNGVERTPAMFRSPPRELRVLLVGWRGAGKSSVGNVLLGCHVFESGQPTKVSVRRQAFVAGRRLTIVDTPGWDWFSVQRTPSNIRKEIKLGAGLLHPGPHALLLVIPVVSTLTLKKRQAIKSHLEMFGEEACLHTLVLFSCGDWLYDTSIEDHIQRNGDELLKLMKHCWNSYHVLDCTKASKDRAQVMELLQKIEEMVAENAQEPFLPVKLNQELDEEENSGKCILH